MPYRLFEQHYQFLGTPGQGAGPSRGSAKSAAGKALGALGAVGALGDSTGFASLLDRQARKVGTQVVTANAVASLDASAIKASAARPTSGQDDASLGGDGSESGSSLGDSSSSRESYGEGSHSSRDAPGDSTAQKGHRSDSSSDSSSSRGSRDSYDGGRSAQDAESSAADSTFPNKSPAKDPVSDTDSGSGNGATRPAESARHGDSSSADSSSGSGSSTGSESATTADGSDAVGAGTSSESSGNGAAASATGSGESGTDAAAGSGTTVQQVSGAVSLSGAGLDSEVPGDGEIFAALQQLLAWWQSQQASSVSTTTKDTATGKVVSDASVVVADSSPAVDNDVGGQGVNAAAVLAPVVTVDQLVRWLGSQQAAAANDGKLSLVPGHEQAKSVAASSAVAAGAVPAAQDPLADLSRQLWDLVQRWRAAGVSAGSGEFARSAGQESQRAAATAAWSALSDLSASPIPRKDAVALLQSLVAVLRQQVAAQAQAGSATSQGQKAREGASETVVRQASVANTAAWSPVPVKATAEKVIAAQLRTGTEDQPSIKVSVASARDSGAGQQPYGLQTHLSQIFRALQGGNRLGYTGAGSAESSNQQATGQQVAAVGGGNGAKARGAGAAVTNKAGATQAADALVQSAKYAGLGNKVAAAAQATTRAASFGAEAVDSAFDGWLWSTGRTVSGADGASSGNLYALSSRIAQSESSAVHTSKSSGKLHQGSASEQVFVNIRRAVARGQTDIQVRLNPRELGQVRLHITVDALNRLSVRVVSEREETDRLLRSDSRALIDALRNSGFDLEEKDLGFDLQEHHEQHSQQSKRRGGRSGSGVSGISEEDSSQQSQAGSGAAQAAPSSNEDADLAAIDSDKESDHDERDTSVNLLV